MAIRSLRRLGRGGAPSVIWSMRRRWLVPWPCWNPTVPVGSTTFLDQTPVPGFQHSGLGLDQQWYYRIAAIDAAGHLGHISTVVTPVTGNAIKIEGESLVLTATGAAPIVAQTDCCGVIWSGNAQLWFKASKAGDYVILTINVPKAGTYDLSAAITKAPDYGIVALLYLTRDRGGSTDAWGLTERSVRG